MLTVPVATRTSPGLDTRRRFSAANRAKPEATRVSKASVARATPGPFPQPAACTPGPITHEGVPAAIRSVVARIERCAAQGGGPALVLTMNPPLSGRLVVQWAGPGSVTLSLSGGGPGWSRQRSALLRALAERGVRGRWR